MRGLKGKPKGRNKVRRPVVEPVVEEVKPRKVKKVKTWKPSV